MGIEGFVQTLGERFLCVLSPLKRLGRNRFATPSESLAIRDSERVVDRSRPNHSRRPARGSCDTHRPLNQPGGWPGVRQGRPSAPVVAALTHCCAMVSVN